MPYYRSVGEIPPKRHTQFRQADGTLVRRGADGGGGFTLGLVPALPPGHPVGDLQLLALETARPDDHAQPPSSPVHLKLHELFADQDPSEVDHVTGRRLVLGNGDVRISYVVGAKASPLYRNAIGDECVYIESGRGTVETMFGTLTFRDRDYVLLPRATVHRWLPDGTVQGVRDRGQLPYPPAERYLSKFGQLLEHSPYCERDLHGPDRAAAGGRLDVEVYTLHRGTGPGGLTGSIVIATTHPFDVVGWDGCLYPYTFNVDDFEPITGRVHQPPPVHQVFEGNNFVICNFVPRKVDYHPLAIPVPYYHSNVDSDEVMFYCGGDYEARKGSGIALGSISLHPGGHSHGPQPGALRRPSASSTSTSWPS